MYCNQNVLSYLYVAVSFNTIHGIGSSLDIRIGDIVDNRHIVASQVVEHLAGVEIALESAVSLVATLQSPKQVADLDLVGPVVVVEVGTNSQGTCFHIG